jgi:hypothetical protein
MSHTPKTPTPSYTTANLPTDLPEGSVVFDSSLQKLVSFKLGSWGTLGGVGSTTYVRGDVAGVIDQIQGDIPDNWKDTDTSLKGLVIGTSCTSIGRRAFSSCVNLTGSLIIPDSVTSIGVSAFGQCLGLTSLNLGNGVVTIDRYAFLGTTNLTGILTIPNSVKTIGQTALSVGDGVTTMHCYVERSVLGNDTITNTLITTIHVRSTDSTWTSGFGQTIGGKANITVIKDL